MYVVVLVAVGCWCSGVGAWNGIGSVLYNTINAFPNEPVRNADGTFSYLEEVADIINPVAQIQNQYNWSYSDKFVGKEEFIKGLILLVANNGEEEKGFFFVC